VSWFRANLPWKNQSVRHDNRLGRVDRVILSGTFLYWSATHAFRLLGLVVPILFLLFGIQAVHASVQDVLSYFCRASFSR